MKPSWPNLFSIALCTCGLLLLAAREAAAYIDPGTGSYLLQIALAALLGGLFAVKMFWRNVKAFLQNLRPGRRKQSEDDQ